MYRVGIVGAGEISGGHIPAYSRIQHVKITAICDRNIEKARMAAQRYGIAGVYESCEKMLEKEEFDIISVLAPDYFHKEICLAAISRGINVLCEKPLASDYGDAKEIVTAANKKGVKLIVSQNYRWFPEVRQLKKDIGDGLIGEPYFIEAKGYARWSEIKTGLSDPRQISSVPYWGIHPEGNRNQWSTKGVHSIDLLRYITSKEVTKIYLNTGRHGGQSVPAENISVAMLSFGDELKALITHCWGSHTWGSRSLNFSFTMRVEGEEGTIIISRGHKDDPYDSRTQYAIYKDNIKIKERKIISQPPELPDGKAQYTEVWISTFESVMRELIESIEHNREPLTGGNDNLKTLRVIEQGYLSAQKDQVVEI